MGKVLILDDDEVILEGLSLALEHVGLEVRTTSSPFELPFLLRREKPDVALIDLCMPSLTGQRVFEALAPSLRGKTNFLIFSGRVDTDLGVMAAENGAVDFLSKADDLDAIVRRIVFWVNQASGTAAPHLEPHVAVVTDLRESEAARTLRNGGYFVTRHSPGDVPQNADAIVIEGGLRSGLPAGLKPGLSGAWRTGFSPSLPDSIPVVIMTPAVRAELLSTVDRRLADARRRPAAVARVDCTA
jgi:FixJ family two-component response regulator